MTNDQHYSARQQGFTLIEVLVVIGLISIISAISYPSFKTFINKYNFRAASREVLTTAMQARSNAVRDNRSWRIDFDSGTTTFRRVDSAGGNQNHNLGSYGNGIRLIGATETSCGNATKNWSGNAIDQAASITFTGRGFRLTGETGQVFLEDRNNDVCFAVSASASGVVKIRRYNGTTPYANSNWN